MLATDGMSVFPIRRDTGLWDRDILFHDAFAMFSAYWRRTAALICLIVAPLAQLAQYLVSPVRQGVSADAQVSSAAAHLGVMRLALVLDLPILLILPAILFAGMVARSRLGTAGAAVSFATALGAGYLLAQDVVIYAAARQPRPSSAVVSAFAGNGVVVFLVGLYLIGHVVGFALLGAALIRSRAVPVWAGAALCAWPILEMLGEGLDAKPVAVAGFLALLVGFAACAFTLVKPSVPVILSDPGARMIA